MATAVYTSFSQQSDSNGVPLNAGTVTVYSAGTTTLVSLFTDSALSAAAANPITLDSSGCHDMRFMATASYKVVVKNSAGSTIRTRDNIDPGVAIGSGALSVLNGGTGATSASSARTNLGAAASTEMSTAQSDISNLQEFTGYNRTDSTSVAVGTTAQRPVSPAAGMVRRNSSTGVFEAYGSGWTNLQTGDSASTAANLRSETAEDTFPRPDRIKHSPGVAKAWGFITVSSGTPSLTVGYNVTSITDNGVGDYTINFTTAFSSSDFVIVAMPFNIAATNGKVMYMECSAKTASTARILALTGTTSSSLNTTGVDTSFFFVAFGAQS